MNVENVVIRAANYHRRHPQQRYLHQQRITYILHHHFELPPRQIATLMQIHPATARRHIDNEVFLLKHSATEKKAIDKLYDYILYNARYIP